MRKIYVDGGQDFICYIDESNNNSPVIEGIPNTENITTLPQRSRRATMLEYRAILEALRSVPEKEEVEIISDCLSAVQALTRGPSFWGTKPKVHKKPIRAKHQSIRRLIKRKRLKVKFTWVHRKENLAGRELENYLKR